MKSLKFRNHPGEHSAKKLGITSHAPELAAQGSKVSIENYDPDYVEHPLLIKESLKDIQAMKKRILKTLIFLWDSPRLKKEGMFLKTTMVTGQFQKNE